MIRLVAVAALVLFSGCLIQDSRTEIQRRKDYESDLVDMAHSYELQAKHADKWNRLDKLDRQG